MIVDLNSQSNVKPDITGDFTLVDGSFDPLHHGHIKYFQDAALLGLPVACLIAPDSYTLKKHRILLAAENRAKVISQIRIIDDVYFGEIDTVAAIKFIKPRYFFKGGDWNSNLPESIVNACIEIGCEVRFGPNPIESSSLMLRKLNNE